VSGESGGYHTESLKKAVASYRSEVAALKRRIDTLERQAKRTQRVMTKSVASEPQPNTPHLRFRAEGLKGHRERLGLSASDVAKILGCSQLSVYKWESGKTRPRETQLQSVALLRKMGKREALKRLQALETK
jgi:DNA-binding transcriptional regulator YiaG